MKPEAPELLGGEACQGRARRQGRSEARGIINLQRMVYNQEEEGLGQHHHCKRHLV